MTNQQLFDFVCNALMAQGCKSSAGDDNRSWCMYRSPDGLKCAAGHLIANKYYRRAIENKIACHEPARGVLVASGIQEDQIPLIRALQQIHDDFDELDWPQGLRNVAESYSLTPPSCILEDE